ncbi:MAG: hypothetical protein ACTSVZ_04055 [Promethearchaeota archaeon]
MTDSPIPDKRDSPIPLPSPLRIWGSSILDERDVQIQVLVMGLRNGGLVMVSDNPQFGLGTLSISIPPNNITDRAIGTPITVFGLKHTTLTNIIGKRASKQLGQPVLAILNLQDHDLPAKQLQKMVMETVAQALERAVAFLKENK